MDCETGRLGPVVTTDDGTGVDDVTGRVLFVDPRSHFSSLTE
jgi:hypothetical protein